MVPSSQKLLSFYLDWFSEVMANALYREDLKDPSALSENLVGIQ